MFLVGLTGGIASGKSTISGMLTNLGAEVIDADLVAREVVQPGTDGLRQVEQAFGEQILDAAGNLSRTELAAIIFQDPARRAVLEEILHPLIKMRTMELIRESTSKVIVYAVPLLVEANVDYPFDMIVTVEAGIEKQIERLVETRGMTRQEALSRINAQATEAQRIERADVSIDGSLSMPLLEKAVSELWGSIQLKASKKAANGTH
jgi:dephospho-CoA kinase